MKRLISMWVVTGMLSGLISNAYALPDTGPYWFDRDVSIAKTENLNLGMWGRAQMLGVGQYVPDPYAQHDRVYLFLKESRLGWDGNYGDWFKFQTEFAWGGEDANGSNTDLSLMDFVADVPIKPLGEDTIFKVGQFRVPYSREGLEDEGYVDFADRSIANLGTYQGRDYGLAVMSTQGNWTGTIGTFSGGGRDIPQRYLPEQIGIPELVGRFGYNDGVDKDIYHVVGTDLNLKRDTKAVYFNGLYMEDTRIGHSTAMLSRTTDKNLLVDTNYNPYIDQGDLNAAGASKSAICSATSCERGQIYFVGGDAVYRHPLDGNRALEGTVQGDWGGYSNRFGGLHVATARAQGDYQVGKWEIGARYGLLSMDSRAGFLSTTAPTPGKSESATLIPGSGSNGTTATYLYSANMGNVIHEITPSIAYHFWGNSMKVIADLPIYLNCPLWIDHVDGAYSFPDPTSVDEDSVLSNSTGANTERRTVVNARMEFQFQF